MDAMTYALYLSPDDRKIQTDLAEHYGASKADVVRFALRFLAQERPVIKNVEKTVFTKGDEHE